MSDLLFERAFFWTRFFPLFSWCLVIFTLSALPGSGLAYDPPLWYILERKAAHVFEYTVLTWLAVRFLIAYFPMWRWRSVALVSGLFSLLYGALDEFHQSFVFGRGARFSDVAIDGIGIFFVLIVLTFLKRYDGILKR